MSQQPKIGRNSPSHPLQSSYPARFAQASSASFGPTQGITRRAGILSVLGSAMVLAGCGGGGGGASAAGAGPGVAGGLGAGETLTVGQITGFGSIILNGNGVRIDDSSCSISDDDGNDLRGKLKLGMVVAVVSSSNASSTAVTARSIVTVGELQGRIEGAPNATQKTFVVMGQTVKVVGATVFDASLALGFNALANDVIVEVHGQINAQTNVITASFIERKSTPSLFKVQGIVSNHDAVAKTFKVGNALIQYSATTDLRLSPVNGALLRVRVNAVLPPAPLPSVWQATRLQKPDFMDNKSSEFEIEGSVTAFTSAKAFSVNGVPVDAGAAVFLKGAQTGLAVGARVEVKGAMVNGVLVAVRVSLEDANDLDQREFELHGAISKVTATSFELRGLTVEYGTGTEFRKGSAANLVNGALVEVKGTASDPAGTATRINATRISFET